MGAGAFGLLTAAAQVAGILLLVSAVALWQVRRGRGRIERWARRRGWRYSASAEAWRPVAGRLAFLGGHLGPAVSGSYQGWPVIAFRVRPRADSVSTKTFAVVAVAVPLPLPGFSLRPRTRVSSVVAAFGEPEVRTGVPAFDARVLVQTRDALAVGALLRPPLTERLLGFGPVPVLVTDRWVVTWTATRDVPGAMARQLPVATGIARTLIAAATSR